MSPNLAFLSPGMLSSILAGHTPFGLLSLGLGTRLFDDVWNTNLLIVPTPPMCHQPRLLSFPLLLAQRPCLHVLKPQQTITAFLQSRSPFTTIAGHPLCRCGVSFHISTHNVYLLLVNSILTPNMPHPTAFQQRFLQNLFISNSVKPSLSLSIQLM
jgi:hypothetical protein